MKARNPLFFMILTLLGSTVVAQNLGASYQGQYELTTNHSGNCNPLIKIEEDQTGCINISRQDKLYIGNDINACEINQGKRRAYTGEDSYPGYGSVAVVIYETITFADSTLRIVSDSVETGDDKEVIYTGKNSITATFGRTNSLKETVQFEYVYQPDMKAKASVFTCEYIKK